MAPGATRWYWAVPKPYQDSLETRSDDRLGVHQAVHPEAGPGDARIADPGSCRGHLVARPFSRLPAASRDLEWKVRKISTLVGVIQVSLQREGNSNGHDRLGSQTEFSRKWLACAHT